MRSRSPFWSSPERVASLVLWAGGAGPPAPEALRVALTEVGLVALDHRVRDLDALGPHVARNPGEVRLGERRDVALDGFVFERGGLLREEVLGIAEAVGTPYQLASGCTTVGVRPLHFSLGADK